MRRKSWSTLAGGAFLSIDALSFLLHLALLFLNHTYDQREKGIGLAYRTLNVIIEKNATCHGDFTRRTKRNYLLRKVNTTPPPPLAHP